MANKPAPADEEPTETTTVRVNRKTLRLMQIISAWKNCTLCEYVDHLVRTQGQKDIEEMKKGVSNL